MSSLDYDELLQNMLVAVAEVVEDGGPELHGCLERQLQDIKGLAKDVQEALQASQITQEQADFFNKAVQKHLANAMETCGYKQTALLLKAMHAALDVFWAAVKAAAPL